MSHQRMISRKKWQNALKSRSIKRSLKLNRLPVNSALGSWSLMRWVYSSTMKLLTWKTSRTMSITATCSQWHWLLATSVASTRKAQTCVCLRRQWCISNVIWSKAQRRLILRTRSTFLERARDSHSNDTAQFLTTWCQFKLRTAMKTRKLTVTAWNTSRLSTHLRRRAF